MIARHSFVRRALLALVAPALLAAASSPALAQGKGKHAGGNAQSSAKPAAKGSAKNSAKPKSVAPGKAKHRVSHDEAVDVSRRVLVEQGYVVTRVERVGGNRVIYYYRGNNGRGKGHGPLQRIVVRPSADRYVFEGAPSNVLKAVTMRLHF